MWKFKFPSLALCCGNVHLLKLKWKCMQSRRHIQAAVEFISSLQIKNALSLPIVRACCNKRSVTLRGKEGKENFKRFSFPQQNKEDEKWKVCVESSTQVKHSRTLFNFIFSYTQRHCARCKLVDEWWCDLFTLHPSATAVSYVIYTHNILFTVSFCAVVVVATSLSACK